MSVQVEMNYWCIQIVAIAVSSWVTMLSTGAGSLLQMHNSKETVRCNKMILKKSIIFIQPQIICLNQKKSWKELASMLVFRTGRNKWFTASVSAAFRPAIKARKLDRARHGPAIYSTMSTQAVKHHFTLYSETYLYVEYLTIKGNPISGDFSGILQLRVTQVHRQLTVSLILSRNLLPEPGKHIWLFKKQKGCAQNLDRN